MGVTFLEPDAVGVTTPILLSIENEFAPDVVHQSVEVPPELIMDGMPVSVHKLEVCAGMVMLAWQVLFGAVALSVNLYVCTPAVSDVGKVYEPVKAYGEPGCEQ